MKKSLFVLAALACTGFMAVGCGDTDPCEDYKCTEAGTECQDIFGIATCVVTPEACAAVGDGYAVGSNGKCQKESGTADCTKDSECSSDGSMKCNTTTGKCEYATIDDQNAYRYVRIDDLTETKSTSEDLGADIDAIVLVKADKSVGYADEVVAYQRGDIDVKSNTDKAYAYDPEAALKAPDSLITYGTSDAATCNYYLDDAKTKYSFVSLGGKGNGEGTGGYLIVHMDKVIAAGDKIDVIELGDCKIPGGTTKDGKDIKSASTDPVKVSIGITDKIDGDWKVIVDSAEAKGGVISGEVKGI